jgi:DNA repair ATPase RecN
LERWQQGCERRHQRERFALDRRSKALGRLEARELRSLENAVRRQVQEMEAAREQKAETLQDRIEVNKLDITLPEGELHAATKKQDPKGWKARQEKLSAGRGQKQNRPRGHRHTRDDL